VLALAVWPRARAGGAPVPRPATRSIAARELYLRGNDPALTRSDSGARASVEYFRQAIALDSTYVAAYAGLARMLMRHSNVGAGSTEPRRRQLMLAQQAAERAVSLDDSSGDAHAALAFVRRNSYDVAGATREMRRAAALDPRDPRIREWLVQLDVVAGRPAEALAEARRAVALEPLSATANAELARALSAATRCDDALTRLRSLESVRPLLLRAASIAAECYARKGMWPEAIAEERRTLFDQRRGNGLLGFLFARAGRISEARLLLDTLVAGSRGGLSGAYDIAVVYAGLGVKDSADIWLARSVDDGSLDFEYINTTLDALSPDATVDALRRRIGIQNR
jgi:tetratricopeptide (TPR) repeat protein